MKTEYHKFIVKADSSSPGVPKNLPPHHQKHAQSSDLEEQMCLKKSLLEKSICEQSYQHPTFLKKQNKPHFESPPRNAILFGPLKKNTAILSDIN